jgi:hypothetical protein
MSDHPALRDAILVIPGVKQGLFSQPEIRDRLIKTGHLTETPDDRNRLNQNVVRLKKSELLKVRPARNGADEAVPLKPISNGSVGGDAGQPPATPAPDQETIEPLTATPTMEQLGHEIKVVLGKSENMRLTAACKLAEARKRFDAGERCDRKSWKDWIEKYAGLSEDNAKVLLRIGRADDPEQQLALENDRAAKGMKKTRARATAMQVEIYAKWIADASRNADSSDAKMLKNTSNSISVRPSRRRHEGATGGGSSACPTSRHHPDRDPPPMFFPSRFT